MATKKQKIGNVPNLRFPGFEREWKKAILGEICTVNPKSSNFPTSFTYIDLESVVDGILLKKQIMAKEDAPSRAQRVLEKEDVLFQMVRPYQKNNFYFDLKGDYVASTGYAQIRSNQDQRYIFQYLHYQKFVDKVLERCTGTSYPAINSNDLSSIPVLIPDLSEQRKIADFMSILDSRIVAQNKIIEKLETLMRGLREKLFAQKMRFKDQNGNYFPDWEVKPLGEILTIGSGKDYRHLERGDIPVFGTGGLMTYVNSFLYDGETVCIGRKGTINKPMYYSGKIWTVDTLFYTHSFLNCAPKFIFYIFQGINWLENNEASGVPSLSKNTIEKIQFKKPTLPEQVLIANLLSSIDEKIETERQILAQYESQKRYLLQSMFI